MRERSILAGTNPRATRESLRFAYWTGLLVVVALLVGSTFDPPVRLASDSLAWRLLVAVLAVSLAVTLANAALGGSPVAGVAAPVAVAFGVVLVSVHGVLVGATTPDQTPVGFALLSLGMVLLAAVAGFVSHLVGSAIGWLRGVAAR